MATLLGIDYGHKKIGFAVGQTVTENSQPLVIVKVNGEMWRNIDNIFEQWQPKIVVIGKPKLADGKPHPLEKMIETFIIELKVRYNTAIYREDESLTSFEAAEFQQKGRQDLLDAHAAALILESWMRANPL